MAFLTLLSLPLGAQQQDIRVADVFGGFTHFDSPHINLGENGFHFQAGVNPKTWYAVGFDYSIASGTTVFKPSMLTTSLAQALMQQLTGLASAGVLPPNYQLALRVSSRTQTFAAGPELTYRHFIKTTLFIRPSIGAVYELATPLPGDPISTGIGRQLAPSGRKRDWTPFYGVGGGMDFNLNTRFSVRAQVDIVHDHLFADLLKDGRNTVRVSVGPVFHFGHRLETAD